VADQRDVVLRYLRALQTGDPGELDAVVAEDVVVRKPDGDVAFRDRKTWKAALVDLDL
jgi:ketosteroid isomerase-like protein